MQVLFRLCGRPSISSQGLWSAAYLRGTLCHPPRAQIRETNWSTAPKKNSMAPTSAGIWHTPMRGCSPLDDFLNTPPAVNKQSTVPSVASIGGRSEPLHRRRRLACAAWLWPCGCSVRVAGGAAVNRCGGAAYNIWNYTPYLGNTRHLVILETW